MAAGGVLIVVGGFSKPVYKLILALSTGPLDVSVLGELLFWFLAPGFVILTAGLRRAVRVDRHAPPTALRLAVTIAGVSLLVAGSLALVGSEAWFFILLAVTTVANAWTVFVLVRWSSYRQDRRAGALFVASLVIALGLAGAAASLEQTIPVQWGEQLASTVSQGLFLWGSLRLSRAMSRGDQRSTQ